MRRTVAAPAGVLSAAASLALPQSPWKRSTAADGRTLTRATIRGSRRPPGSPPSLRRPQRWRSPTASSRRRDRRSPPAKYPLGARPGRDVEERFEGTAIARGGVLGDLALRG